MPGKKLHLRTLMLMLSVGGILLTSMLLLSALTFFQKGNMRTGCLRTTSLTLVSWRIPPTATW
nr:Uncharacterised protein [Raoultella sp. NCTC 9187]